MKKTRVNGEHWMKTADLRKIFSLCTYIDRTPKLKIYDYDTLVKLCIKLYETGYYALRDEIVKLMKKGWPFSRKISVYVCT